MHTKSFFFLDNPVSFPFCGKIGLISKTAHFKWTTTQNMDKMTKRCDGGFKSLFQRQCVETALLLRALVELTGPQLDEAPLGDAP